MKIGVVGQFHSRTSITFFLASIANSLSLADPPSWALRVRSDRQQGAESGHGVSRCIFPLFAFCFWHYPKFDPRAVYVRGFEKAVGGSVIVDGSTYTEP